MQKIRKILNEKAHQDLDAIELLERQLKIVKRKKIHSDKELNKLSSKRIELKVPSEQAQSDRILLEERLEIHLKQEQDLGNTQSELKEVSNRLKDAKWNYEVLFQKYQVLEKNTREYRNQFEHQLLKSQAR